MGETRVDLLHLLEDLRDAYPGSIEETILTEVMANSLDSGATEIRFDCDPANRVLTIIDDGAGMQRRELARYHDIASSTKTRGEGIGFAGVGIKLGLLICDEVLTETRRGKNHVATTWHMASRYRAPWKWTPPLGLLAERGTAVRLTLQNALAPLLDGGFLEGTLRRHFQPLLDPTFNEFLSLHYPHGVTIIVNGRTLEKQRWTAALQAPLEIRLLRRRKPSAFGYLFREDSVLPDERRGLAISTYGKVIRRGWDWLGMTPSMAEGVGGLIEVPELAACLTLNKGDFIRVGPRGATYLGFRKAIQEAVARQLTAWGDAQGSAEEAPPKELRPLQRDLAQLLQELADDFPLLASLVEQRAGGQKRLPLGTGAKIVDGAAFVSASVAEQADTYMGTPGVSSAGGAAAKPNGLLARPPATTDQSNRDDMGITLQGQPVRRRPAHYGLDIQFADRSEDSEIARLVESTVWINRAHPAYRRALASRAVGYHIALGVAMALAPLAVEPAHEHSFITTFLSRWGEAIDKPSGRGKSRRELG